MVIRVNKEIKLTKTTKILFVINLLVLLSLIAFRYIYNYLVYYPVLVNVFLVINILILLFGIIFNIITLKNENKYNNSKYVKLIIILFIVYLLLNTIGIYIINKPIENKYKKISDKLSSYCTSFYCDTYNTKYVGKNRVFIIKKEYLDYNNNINTIEIKTYYNKNNIYKIDANIYTDNDSFSPNLIKNELDKYFSNFNISLNEEAIEKSFENRFEKEIEKDNIIYRVSEIYDKKVLTKLKIRVICNIK